MKRIFLLATLFAGIQCSMLTAQKAPRWLEKAQKAMLTVETYDAGGHVRRGNGFFTGENGEAVSDYALFDGAASAFVTDADGRKMPVTHVLGADDMYDVIHFRVTVPRNTPYLQSADALPPAGSEAYTLPPVAHAGEPFVRAAITEVSKIRESYGYYKIDAPLPAAWISVPLLTPDGKVFAMTQADASGKNKTFGISVPYVQHIRIGSMDLWNKTYTSLGIRKAWPPTQQDAQVALMLQASQQDAPAYLETLNDYIVHFPRSYDGYAKRASHRAHFRNELAATEAERQQMLALAAEDMTAAHKYADNEAEAYFDRASLIYAVATGDSAVLPDGWNMDAASEYLQRAISADNKPAYYLLEGNIAFSQEDYEKAFRSYAIVNQSAFASSASYYMAAKARQQMPGHNPGEVITLLDSAILKSLPSEALPYLEECAGLKMDAGMYEAAVKDYDQCYSLTAGNVSDAFYYLREQAKFRSGNLDGALTDIAAAVRMQPDNAVYHAEMASVYLRRQEPALAQECVEKALAIDPDFASSYRLLGVCYLRQEKKDEACIAFRKAEERGDPVVKKLIRENCGETK
ncbi:MAG: tetratricopeptide repeat protein [Tannerella sp.]|nr:tetratricopeptide repeat protein [Tannerella sp.]